MARMYRYARLVLWRSAQAKISRNGDAFQENQGANRQQAALCCRQKAGLHVSLLPRCKREARVLCVRVWGVYSDCRLVFKRRVQRVLFPDLCSASRPA